MPSARNPSLPPLSPVHGSAWRCRSGSRQKVLLCYVCAGSTWHAAGWSGERYAISCHAAVARGRQQPATCPWPTPSSVRLLPAAKHVHATTTQRAVSSLLLLSRGGGGGSAVLRRECRAHTTHAKAKAKLPSPVVPQCSSSRPCWAQWVRHARGDGCRRKRTKFQPRALCLEAGHCRYWAKPCKAITMPHWPCTRHSVRSGEGRRETRGWGLGGDLGAPIGT